MNDPAALVVDALRQAMEGLDRKPDLTDWRIGRIAELESAIREFAMFMIDSGNEIGMGEKFHHQFSELCEAVGFDADEYREEGFDRTDV